MASDNYLKNIHSPADIKGMSYAQLNELAAEIRTVLIDTVSKNGGHLASNLGVVELTLAMHKEFDSPRDKFVWDVGHQAYTHKLLTGRYERFHTLRQEGGLSAVRISAHLRRRSKRITLWSRMGKSVMETAGIKPLDSK